MPGGQSASVFGASFEVFERSTGTSTSIFGGVFFTVVAVGVGVVVVGGGRTGFGGGDMALEEDGRRIFSMEKLRLLA